MNYDNGKCIWTKDTERPRFCLGQDIVMLQQRMFGVEPIGTVVMWVIPYICIDESSCLRLKNVRFDLNDVANENHPIRERLLLGSSVDFEVETSTLIALSMGIAPKAPGGFILGHFIQNMLEIPHIATLAIERPEISGVALFDMSNQELVDYAETN